MRRIGWWYVGSTVYMILTFVISLFVAAITNTKLDGWHLLMWMCWPFLMVLPHMFIQMTHLALRPTKNPISKLYLWLDDEYEKEKQLKKIP